MDPVQPPITESQTTNTPPSISSSQTPIQSIPDQPEKKSKRLQSLVIIIAALIVIAIVIPMSLPIIGRMTQQKTTILPSPTVEVLPTITLDPTANWKTFILEKITFKYPSTWTNPEYIDIPSGKSAEIKNETERQRIIVLSGINKDSSEKTRTEFINSLVGAGGEKLTLDSTDAVKVISTFRGNTTTVYVNSQDKTSQYSISLQTQDSSAFQENNTLLDQILSTFKFTDSASPTCMPRPKCLDVEPYCMLEPMGTWCPQSQATTSVQKQNDVMCAQDAKECPDGSFVERVGPNCEFKTC